MEERRDFPTLRAPFTHAKVAPSLPAIRVVSLVVPAALYQAVHARGSFVLAPRILSNRRRIATGTVSGRGKNHLTGRPYPDWYPSVPSAHAKH